MTHEIFCVEFDDGEVSKLTANVIVESRYDSCDDSRNCYLIMESIVDYRNTDKTTTFPDQKVVHRGQSFMRRSTVGWQLCFQWRDGSISWQALKYLKELQPLETSKYDAATVNWWVNSVLKKRLRILSLDKKRNA